MPDAQPAFLYKKKIKQKNQPNSYWLHHSPIVHNNGAFRSTVSVVHLLINTENSAISKHTLSSFSFLGTELQLGAQASNSGWCIKKGKSWNYYKYKFQLFERSVLAYQSGREPSTIEGAVYFSLPLFLAEPERLGKTERLVCAPPVPCKRLHIPCRTSSGFTGKQQRFNTHF